MGKRLILKSRIIEPDPRIVGVYNRLMELKKMKPKRISGRTVRSKRGGDEKKPHEAHDTSYLYMQAHEGDNGDRPAPQPYWVSPDINLLAENTSSSDVDEVTSGIVPGKQYYIECTVRNKGDLDVPSASVEIHLWNPTLGCTVSNSKLIGIAATRVPSMGYKTLVFPWVPETDDGGHKCLIGRVYSFSPMDFPSDFEALDPCNDRHVAMQNLLILEEEEEMGVDSEVETGGEDQKKAIPFVFQIRPVEQLPQIPSRMSAIHRFKFRPASTNTQFGLEIRKDQVRKGAKIALRQRSANSWEGTIQGQTLVPLLMRVPKIGLGRGEALAFNIIRSVPRKKGVRGGIMFIVRRKS
jgi:hypothetical protein